MAKYDRDTIISKLKSMGFNPLYNKSQYLYGFECSRKQKVGIKILGYLDFLKAKLIKK